MNNEDLDRINASEDMIICYDLFTFDALFRVLLRNGYDHEEALMYVIANCDMSALVFQDRTHNNYYEKIKVDEEFSPDLLKLINKEIQKQQKKTRYKLN